MALNAELDRQECLCNVTKEDNCMSFWTELTANRVDSLIGRTRLGRHLQACLTAVREYMPPFDHQLLSKLFLLGFLLLIAGHLPWLLKRASDANRKLNGQVPTIGDDSGYVIPAINLINGYGYSDGVHMPIERYQINLSQPGGQYQVKKIQDNGYDKPSSGFTWAPGTTFLLACVYYFFGTETIVALRLMAALLCITGLLLVATGYLIAGWVGVAAGGLAALYHLHYFPGIYNFERILSENPTAFSVSLACFLFALLLKWRSYSQLIVTSFAFSFLLLFRANFLPALFFCGLYLFAGKFGLKKIIVFITCSLSLALGWSIYATKHSNKIVFISSHGDTLFADTNNLDTVEGIGPEHLNQGGWNPGFYRKPDGSLGADYHNQLKPGESGWVKGFNFWKTHPSLLPKLFYVKMRTGFWHNNGSSQNWLQPEGFYLLGIGFLLISIGLLPIKMPVQLTSPRLAPLVLILQLALISLLFYLWNKHGFTQVLLAWVGILLLSIVHLFSKRQYVLPFQNPVWLLSLVLCHGITTVIFYGIRFHFPIDPVLMLVAFLGIFTSFYELFRRNLPMFLGFSGVVANNAIIPLGMSSLN